MVCPATVKSPPQETTSQEAGAWSLPSHSPGVERGLSRGEGSIRWRCLGGPRGKDTVVTERDRSMAPMDKLLSNLPKPICFPRERPGGSEPGALPLLERAMPTPGSPGRLLLGHAGLFSFVVLGLNHRK